MTRAVRSRRVRTALTWILVGALLAGVLFVGPHEVLHADDGAGCALCAVHVAPALDAPAIARAAESDERPPAPPRDVVPCADVERAHAKRGPPRAS